MNNPLFSTFNERLRRRAVASWTGAILFAAVASAQAQSYTFIDLGVSSGTAVNNRGEVAGYFGTGFDNGTSNAFVWDRGSTTLLGTLPGYPQQSAAMALNDHGQVVGVVSNAFVNTGEAFVWESGAMTGLGHLLGGTYSIAMDINNKGQIVGSSR